MTVVAAVIFGVISGFVVRGARRAALGALVPWLVVLALQTWLLASGRGSNPSSTVREAGYWLVQVVALAICLGVAGLVATVRTRRAARTGEAAAIR